ncbi:MAG: carboxypeptidase-like regulatory domain-containing protein [Candidatus Acidiferrales bacterium]
MQLLVQQSPGSISGTIVDPRGDAVAGARVDLAREDQSAKQETLSGDDGQYSFGSAASGPFQLTIAKEGFATQAISGTLHPGETYNVPRIALALAPEKTEVQVVVPRVEVAEEQIKEEEKQRVLGFVPNFYVSYVPDAAPLTPKQKFELAWKTSVDPVTFVLTGAVAGVQQANNVFSGYGQGAAGYGKRYGADYADSVTNIFIGSAILPSLLKQDPRYFYKGSGSTRSRILYAIANSVICKGDNGRWQANYSNVLGSLAAGGISNLYYPAQDRNGAALTFENAAIEVGASAAANLLQEFVIRKLTSNVRSHDPAKP